MKQKYTEEFKLQALKLADELGSVVEATKQLGLKNNAIYNWKVKYNYEFQNSKSRPVVVTSPESEEIKRLRKENEELKKVNYILKRAAAFFSQDHLK